ncbi:MAG: hypothetical protein OEW68_08590 [Gammaproteobacteria bacterium]|nr:hypothetical protein [Gammaproteobacteria bacterium]MDH4314883.1 hypothetical protein [Gammaproteobacteria bacterium]MDH5213795.1 hypothetical protein [Gammaproteobacteria bacterium]MDH5500032.1 hypothetical protein [Gammaproteobacteria bacterium]
MRAIALTFLSILVAGCSGGGEPAYSVLFGEDETRLSADEQQAVFSMMASAFPLSEDGETLTDPNCGDIEPVTEVVDLNGDGSYEVFITWGNSCLSGHAGRSLTLFVKDRSGKYQYQLGFPAAGYDALERGVDGFPELLLGGPGFCFPIWAWDGDNYEFKCNLPQEEGGCEYQGNTCLEE